MKDLQNAFVDPPKESNLNLNKENLLKYLTLRKLD